MWVSIRADLGLFGREKNPRSFDRSHSIICWIFLHKISFSAAWKLFVCVHQWHSEHHDTVQSAFVFCDLQDLPLIPKLREEFSAKCKFSVRTSAHISTVFAGFYVLHPDSLDIRQMSKLIINNDNDCVGAFMCFVLSFRGILTRRCANFNPEVHQF
jgi:hypothetical protein